MSSNAIVVLVFMAAIAMALVTFWRKVLVLMLSVVIAVFFYGVLSLTHLIP